MLEVMRWRWRINGVALVSFRSLGVPGSRRCLGESAAPARHEGTHTAGETTGGERLSPAAQFQWIEADLRGFVNRPGERAGAAPLVVEDAMAAVLADVPHAAAAARH